MVCKVAKMAMAGDRILAFRANLDASPQHHASAAGQMETTLRKGASYINRRTAGRRQAVFPNSDSTFGGRGTMFGKSKLPLIFR
jgi:hypothetical protein